METLRYNDYQRLNPPPLKTLPLKQIPDERYDKYCLNGETDLVKFFKELEEDKKQEEVIKANKPEPRGMQKVLNYVSNELKNHNQKQRENQQNAIPDRSQLLNDLPLK